MKSYVLSNFAMNGSTSNFVGSQTSVTTTFQTTGNWNVLSNWNNGIPRFGLDNAIIAANVTNAVQSGCGNLRVNPGIEVTNTGTISVGGNVTLQSSAAGSTATVVNTGTFTVNGTTNVEQYLTSSRWWFISNPTNGSDLYFSGLKYIWDEASQNWAFGSTANGGGFIIKPSATSVVSSGDVNTYFQGTINSGNKTVALAFSGTTPFAQDGILYKGNNLVGNPYTAYLDFNLIKAANPSITTSAYFYNSAGGGSYDAYNTLSGAVGIASKYVPPLQSFWVITTAASSLTFSQNQIVSNTTAGNIKLKSEIENKNIRLLVSRGLYNDEHLIVFNQQASNGFDDWDSPKLFADNDSLPILYTKADNKVLTINGMNAPDSIKTIPVYFTTTIAGTFSLTASEISGLDDYSILLKDSLLNQTQDLSQHPVYSFSSDTVKNMPRFSLLLKAGTTTVALTQHADNTVLVYTAGSAIIVSVSHIDSQSTIFVYNALGQLLKQVPVSSYKTEIYNNFTSGSYFVTVQDAHSLVTKRIEKL